MAGRGPFLFALFGDSKRLIFNLFLGLFFPQSNAELACRLLLGEASSSAALYCGGEHASQQYIPSSSSSYSLNGRSCPSRPDHTQGTGAIAN
jgi:hypothetical protein